MYTPFAVGECGIFFTFLKSKKKIILDPTNNHFTQIS